VRLTDGEQHVLIGTRQGQSVRFRESDARPMGRAARGVRGIRLRGDDEVVDMTVFAGEEGEVLSISEQGYGKRTPVGEYRIQGRGGSGIRNFNVTSKTGLVAGLKHVAGDEEVVIMSEQGKVLRSRVEEIRQTGRSAQGVKTLTVDEGDRIAGIAVFEERDEDPAAAEGGEEADPGNGGEEPTEGGE
jgi:DNA gyrase subunit A